MDAEFVLPSVVDAPLIESYSYHSVDAVKLHTEAEIQKNAERAQNVEWMLGVDEAGRGPVLGQYSII